MLNNTIRSPLPGLLHNTNPSVVVDQLQVPEYRMTTFPNTKRVENTLLLDELRGVWKCCQSSVFNLSSQSKLELKRRRHSNILCFSSLRHGTIRFSNGILPSMAELRLSTRAPRWSGYQTYSCTTSKEIITVRRESVQ